MIWGGSMVPFRVFLFSNDVDGSKRDIILIRTGEYYRHGQSQFLNISSNLYGFSSAFHSFHIQTNPAF